MGNEGWLSIDFFDKVCYDKGEVLVEKLVLCILILSKEKRGNFCARNNHKECRASYSRIH